MPRGSRGARPIGRGPVLDVLKLGFDRSLRAAVSYARRTLSRYRYARNPTSLMTFVASPRKRSVGCVYAGRCVYAPDAAFTHTCLYAGVGAYTQVRAYTHVPVYTHPHPRTSTCA